MEVRRTFQRSDGEEIPEAVLETAMELETEKRRQRAARFGTTLKEPSKESLFRDQEDVVQVKRYYSKAEQEYRAFRGDLEIRKEEVAPDAANEDDMEVDEPLSLEGSRGKIRLEALNLRGTDDMSTTDIFAWAGQDHCPLFIEWIDDTSCNMVYDNREKAQSALMYLSEEMPDVAGTPFQGLRRGRPWKKTTLLMRYAYANDKKDSKKRKPSRFYELYGLPGEQSERPNKRQRVENPNAGRQVAIKPMKHRLAMDEEDGEGITILIPNDRYKMDVETPADASPAPTLDEASGLPVDGEEEGSERKPPPAPPSTPASMATPRAPVFAVPPSRPPKSIPEEVEIEEADAPLQGDYAEGEEGEGEGDDLGYQEDVLEAQ